MCLQAGIWESEPLQLGQIPYDLQNRGKEEHPSQGNYQRTCDQAVRHKKDVGRVSLLI